MILQTIIVERLPGFSVQEFIESRIEVIVIARKHMT